MAKPRKKKNRTQSKRIEPKKIPTKKISYAIIALAVVLAGYLFIRNSGYFKVETVKIIDAKNAAQINTKDLLKLYKGRNIFSIDIRSLSSQIKNDYPVVKDAIVRRILPNRLEIDIVARIPIAKIKSYEYFPIDRSGIVLSPEIKTGNLPVIIGFSMWLRPRVGQKLENNKLENAFLLIDALNQTNVFSDYSVTTIDTSNYNNLSFYMENGTEVKIGGEDFLERLKKLKQTFSNPKMDKDNIKYIDLRFRDVVIGPK